MLSHLLTNLSAEAARPGDDALDGHDGRVRCCKCTSYSTLGRYRMSSKRAFDVVVSAVALLATAPIMGALGMVIRSRLGPPVLFRQVRAGLHGRPFELLKFRTMTDARDESGTLLPDERRLTSFGCWLRSTSLDELPELINVLRGDMSLVGPRPLLMHYMPLYSPRQAIRHDVRPGLTGWAQVNGRNTSDWPERLELDAWYVENQSFALDLRILIRTIRTVVLRQGVSSSGHATSPEFEG